MTDRTPTKTPAGADPADALKGAAERLLGILMRRAVGLATERVGGLADRLTEVAEHDGAGLGAALAGGKALAEGKSPVRAALSSGVAGLKKRLGDALGEGGGGGSGTGAGKKPKVTNIVESLDVGLPLRTTYDLWTGFTEFPSFLKKVESVEQPSDEKTAWKAQVFWSHRTWEATIVEQVPDSHIVWRSSAAKGRVDGAVSFTELGPNLTRVLVVLEYWPQGLFERTGNLWRAQGRRARLELKHFGRHAMTHALLRREEVTGWRGEIRDSQVVLDHEEALERERRGRDGDEAIDRDDEPEEARPEDDTAEYDDEDYDDDYDENYDEDYEEHDEHPERDDDADFDDADDLDDESDRERADENDRVEDDRRRSRRGSARVPSRSGRER